MNIALIGCGSIAAAHLAAIKKIIPQSKIYLMDAVKKQAESLAARWGTDGIYDNFDHLLDDARPEAAHILTPPPSHFALAQKALEIGCHVLIEKPATGTAEEFQRLLDLSQKKNKVLAVDYSLLGMPVVRRALSEINSGELGRLISAHCDFACAWPENTIPYGNPSHWAYSLKGGVLQNMADHPASLILDILQPIEEYKVLFVRRNLLPNNCPDLLQVVIRTQDQIGSFTLSLAHGNAERRAYFLLEEGTIMIDLGRQLYFSTRGRGPQNFIKKTFSGLLEGKELVFGTFRNVFRVLTGRLQRDPGIVAIIDNFYQATRGEAELLVSPATAAAVTGLLENIWNEMAKHDSKTDGKVKIKRVNQQIEQRL